ncbi:hypothetical protein RE628_19365 [Paenibacillus sp. D2_2]|uniref:hypothetical protein n=1 Tax=Paenibacillus sp. D2_2 TaxID=3073092 RepID=UPI0028167305|nr:hypothetical protein [Paenibacillus sp. D2_2]WMT39551.1 hypothetical protein RE628_19365 [Paenibacillus sp. D2_2]
MDRQKYCNELNRETFLSAMGYQVISFAYDDVAQRPELCMTLLRMVISRYHPAATTNDLEGITEREIIRLAITLARSLRPVDVVKQLDINHRTAVRMLQALSTKGYFTPIAGKEGRHIVRYELNPGKIQRLL